MNRATSSLAIGLADALALWQALDGTSTFDQEIAARAAHLVVAAETCHSRSHGLSISTPVRR
jgi:hypothetical protein